MRIWSGIFARCRCVTSASLRWWSARENGCGGILAPSSATGIASVAVLVLALMAAGLAARGSRLAAFEASAALRRFPQRFSRRRSPRWTPRVPPGPVGQGRRGLPQSALDHFRVLDDPAMARRGRLFAILCPGAGRGPRRRRRVALSFGRGDASHADSAAPDGKSPVRHRIIDRQWN